MSFPERNLVPPTQTPKGTFDTRARTEGRRYETNVRVHQQA